MNLIDLLPQEDKELMEEYIHLYGINKEEFIGLDKYLKHWAASKKKLYKLLGNQFQLEIPYSYEKSKAEMERRFLNLKNHSFIKDLESALKGSFLRKKIDKEVYNLLWDFSICVDMYVDDKILRTAKFKPSNDAKEIRLQKGMKPIRALQRIVNAYPDIFSIEDFENFRLAHSLCLNDKYVKGTLVLSIHPFDYITMSDNNSDWTSCMSWMDKGCYHIGTVEMMNSNNVIVAYIKSSSSSFDFGKNEQLLWNNKKWRQLIYFTKDIIVSGKPYPYENKKVSLDVIEILKNLAEKNLSWTYTYGPEKYLDMKHINSMHTMDKNREWLKNGDSTKNNILFDTKGMYNDMLNSNVDYWCYRNKVNKMKIISISGKAPCACCGNNALVESFYPENYNDRWEKTERIICEECFEEGKCYSCNDFFGKNDLITVPLEHYEIKICKNCAEIILKKCPCCGNWVKKTFNSYENNLLLGIKLSDEVYVEDYEYFNTIPYFNVNNSSNINIDEISKIKPNPKMTVTPAFMCTNCLNKDLNNPNGLFISTKLKRRNDSKQKWFYPEWKIITKKTYTEEEIIKHPLLSKMLILNIERYKAEQ